MTILRLGLLTLLCGALLALAYTLTRQTIDENQRSFAQQQLVSMLPFSDGVITKTPRGYSILRGGEPYGLIRQHRSSEGYGGDITLLLAYRLDGSIIRVRTLAHRETPGIGDAIDDSKSTWIYQFDGRSLSNTRWALTHQGGALDGISGATITSRAMINAIHQSLQEAANE